uniref:Small ribosomal subunit protein uS8 n=1 Tax=uncultured actinobacterium Rifle_16ft_4_minimus_38826 TaxID=1665148 RepID=A0A0H4TSQ4_9ACTN|nr:30S ribosomal protein S8, small subunit ribosomal protein S8 [uncultured actinobacterium Rifle_16ft_4_minimus_38826]
MVRLATNVTDPIGDLLTRIRNANLAYKDDLMVPASNMNRAILKILDGEGYIEGFAEEGEGIESVLRVSLKYSKKRERTISGLKRVSKPGRRIYTGRDRLPRVLGGLGIAIVSTSQGVMTDKDASRKGIGGEVLAYVW